jgi:hypothetical protein
MNAKAKDILRLVFAGLFVGGGMFALIFVLSHFFHQASMVDSSNCWAGSYYSGLDWRCHLFRLEEDATSS